MAGLVAAVVLSAGPASAHVEVQADSPRAGARDVTVTFTGEGESTTAGIVSEQVQLPAGINPADVRLAKAPSGWHLATTPDGFTVSGPALKPGQDAVLSVTIARLPADATELAFKTLETYSDGDVSRWIQLPEAGKPEPDNPAPILKLQPAATPATPSAAATPSSPAAASTSAASIIDASDNSNDGGNTTLWIVLAVVIVVLVAGSLLVWRRRRPTP